VRLRPVGLELATGKAAYDVARQHRTLPDGEDPGLGALLADHTGAVADGEDRVVPGRLQRRPHGEEAPVVERKAGVAEPGCRAARRAQDCSIARQPVPVVQSQPVGPDLDDPLALDEADIRLLQFVAGEMAGQPVGGGQQGAAGYQREGETARIETGRRRVVENAPAHGVGDLVARRPTADDGDMARTVGCQAARQKIAPDRIESRDRLDRDAVLRRPRDAVHRRRDADIERQEIEAERRVPGH